MSVKIKDRETEVEYLRMACNMAELPITYEQADLVIKLQDGIERFKGDFSISDGVDIHSKWKQQWKDYYRMLADKEKDS